MSQIRLDVWPEPDLAGFQKNGQIPDLPEPEVSTAYAVTDILLSVRCL